MDDAKDLTDKVEESIVYVFKVKYHGTKENVAVHEAFKEYCKEHCQDNYLLGIQRLLELASTDWKYESLYDELQSLKQEIALLKEVKEKPRDNGIKTFGS